MLYFGRSFDKNEISLMTDYDFVAKRYEQAIFNLVRLKPTVVQSNSGKFTVYADSQSDRIDILNELGYTGSEPSMKILNNNIENECCFGSFLRGAFLSCGVITDPKKEYHLEFDVNFKNKGKCLSNLFEDFPAVPKISNRNGMNIVYFKDSSQIEDILTVMGAQGSVMELIGEKIFKDVRNNVNRKVNCDRANIKKTCDAAENQINAIVKLQKSGKFEELSPDLKEIALLRVDNPEMTLSELGENLKVPMSRSSVNRRLKKIIEMSE